MIRIKTSIQCPKCSSSMYLIESSKRISLRCYKCKLSVYFSINDAREKFIKNNILNWTLMLKQLYNTYIELYCE